MRDKIKEALEYDPIYEVEKALGNKHWSKFAEEETLFSMGLCMTHNKNKDNLLKENNDTHFSMSWEDFVGIVKKNGFKCGYEYSFPYEDRTEKAALYYRTDGLVIWATSFWDGKSVNSGTLYGEIKMNNVTDRGNIPSCSNGFHDFENGKLHFDKDVREGLIWFINQMNRYGDFIKEWEEPNKFLWFLDFSEDKIIGYDYDKISKDKIIKAKINLCCSEVKEIMKKYL